MSSEMNIVIKLMLELGGGMIVYFATAFITKNETFFIIFDKVFGLLKKFLKRKAD